MILLLFMYLIIKNNVTDISDCTDLGILGTARVNSPLPLVSRLVAVTSKNNKNHLALQPGGFFVSNTH